MLTVAVVYAIAAPTYVVDADNAELTTLGAIGGGAHPSGYPLYLLLLRATSWLPASSPAASATLATVVISVAQVAALFAAVRAWGASVWATTVSVALFAAGPFVLRMNIQVEVFALNGLIGAVVLWLAAPKAPVRGTRRALLLGLVAGLGMSNHLTCVLLAPVGVWGVSRAWTERTGGKPLVIGAAIAGMVLGLAPYAYLVVTDENLMSWARPASFGDLARIFFRTDYGTTSVGIAGAQPVDAVASLGAYAAYVGRSWLWIPPLLALGALGSRVWRPAEDELRGAWIALAVSWLLAGPVLTWIADAPTIGSGLFVVRRYQLLSLLVLAIPVAVALDEIGRRLRAAARPTWQPAVLATVVFVALAFASLAKLRGVHSPAVELAARNMLGSLPPAAVVLGEGDELHASTRYLQLVLGVRPDVTYVHLRGLGTPWYRERFRPYGLPIDTLGGRDPILAFSRAVLASRRPLFVVSRQLPMLRVLPSYPHGFLLRVLPEGAARPSLDDVLELARTTYARFDLGYPVPGPDDELAMVAHQRYASTWLVLAAALRSAGRSQDADDAESVALQLAPH